MYIKKTGWFFNWSYSKISLDLSYPYLIFVISFTQAKFSENKIYTEKHWVVLHKRCQLSNYYTEKYQFCVHSGKIYTGQKKFTPAPPVVPVTNIRYDPEITYQNFTFQQKCKKISFEIGPYLIFVTGTTGSAGVNFFCPV